MNCKSVIDYILVSDISVISAFDVMDLDSNWSDHRPIIVSCAYERVVTLNQEVLSQKAARSDSNMMKYLRWDRADLLLYRNMTRLFFQQILNDLIHMEKTNTVTYESIKASYCSIVNSLLLGSNAAVPMHRSDFCKFWWDEKLDELKTKSIASCRIRKTDGKPRSGPIFDIYRKDMFAYKHEIRERRLDKNRVYTKLQMTFMRR